MGLKYIPGPGEESRDVRVNASPRAARSWKRPTLAIAACAVLLTPTMMAINSPDGDWLDIALIGTGVLALVIVLGLLSRFFGPRRKAAAEPRCAICGQAVNQHSPLTTGTGKRCPECGSSTG